MGNGTRALTEAGVTLWLDGVSRAQLRSGELGTLIAERNLTGATTSPVAVHGALQQGAYDEQLARLAAGGVTAAEAVEALLTEDATAAADLLLPVHDASGGRDGYVTVTLPPWALGSTTRVVAGARAATGAIGRPNVLVGVPATADGLAAVTELVAAGVGVNVTPTFSPDGCRAAADAYAAGLEKAAANGQGAAVGPAVVSVVVNQVDTDVDKRLWRVGSDQAAALRGTAAVANARLAHAAHTEVVASERWTALVGQGLRPPMLAWTGMAVRDPYYADTHYVDALVVAGVIATLPAETLAAAAEQSTPAGDTVSREYAAAAATLASLAAVDVSLADVVGSLERAGLPRHEHAWRAVQDGVGSRLRAS